MEDRRAKEPIVKGEEICFKERSTNEERKGATKIEQKKRNENVISKVVDEGPKKETWNLEMDNRRKEETTNKRETEKGF